MKIAIVSAFPQKEGVFRGGIEAAVSTLVDSLVKKENIEIVVIAPRKGLNQIEQRGNFQIHWVSQVPLGFLTYSNIMKKRIHKKLAELSPDITHFQGLAAWTIGYKNPHVLTVHGIPEKDITFNKENFSAIRSFFVGLAERKGRKCPNTILINPYILDECGGQIKGKTWNIPNPVSSIWLEEEKKDFKGHLLYVGRISPLKNVLGLLKVFNELVKKRPQQKLVLVGAAEPKEYEIECKHYVEENSLTKNVSFLGQLNRKELNKSFSGASLLLLLSRQDASPIVIAEAMCLGIPVVSSGKCGMAYMIQNNNNGLIVNPDNAKESSESIFELLNDKERYLKMSKNALESTRSIYDLNIVSENTKDVYLEILGWGKA